MKLLKPIFVCLIIFFSNNLLAQTQNTYEDFIDCSDSPELFVIEITDERVVHYLWSYDSSASFYILEYKGIDGCIILNFSEAQDDSIPVITTDPGDIKGSEFNCPPDVWTEVPGPTLKTSPSNSASFKNKGEFANGFFISCMNFEFRMKVICNDDTLYSNVVPYFFDDGNCPDCMPERTLTNNHNSDIVIHAGNRIASNAVVAANVTYKAGERIELKSGFSSKQGFNFKVMTEECSGP